MDITSLENSLRRIAAADIGGHSLYLVMASDLPRNLRLRDRRICGFTSPSLDMTFSGWLQSQNRWHGRGPAIYLNDIGIHESVRRLFVPSDYPGQVDEQIDLRITATALHELGHVLDADRLDFRPITKTRIEQHKEQVKRFVREPIPEQSSEDYDIGDLLYHGVAYIRSLCHVLHRAESKLKLPSISESQVFSHRIYSLSPLVLYRDSLSDELSFPGSFSELRKTKPPASFIELWKSDVRQWWLSREPSEETTRVTLLLLNQFNTKQTA